MKNLKDTLTTIVAILLALFGGLQVYLSANAGKEIDWGQLLLCEGAAITSYLTGKNPNGSTKVIDPTTGQQDANPDATKPT